MKDFVELFTKTKNQIQDFASDDINMLKKRLASKLNSIPMYYYDCIDVEGMDDSTVGIHQKTFLNEYLPLSDDVKWFLNEPFVAPFGYGIHLFLFISILLIILGLIIAYRWNKWIGIILISLGTIDILYYFLH